MRKVIKLVVGNMIFAVGAIVLYSPGLVGLSLGESALKSALCVAVGITSVLGWAGFNVYNVSGRDVKMLENHESTLQELRSSLLQLPRKESIGKSVIASVEQVDKWLQARDEYLRQVRVKFGHTSLTSQKYSSVLDRVEEVLRKNLAVVYNKCVIFKEKEYKLLSSGEYRFDDIDDDIQEQKLELYESIIAEVKERLASNERMLLQLDSLMFRMADIEDGDNDAVEEEIEKLVDELQYYERLGGV